MVVVGCGWPEAFTRRVANSQNVFLLRWRGSRGRRVPCRRAKLHSLSGAQKLSLKFFDGFQRKRQVLGGSLQRLPKRPTSPIYTLWLSQLQRLMSRPSATSSYHLYTIGLAVSGHQVSAITCDCSLATFLTRTSRSTSNVPYK